MNHFVQSGGLRVAVLLMATAAITACDDTSLKPGTRTLTPQQKSDIQQLITKTKADLVYVQGGKFWMGDFCSQMRNGGPYCSSDENNKPLHEVELSSYSMGKFKITHEQFDVYVNATGVIKEYTTDSIDIKMLADQTYFANSPAIISWTEADRYCAWLKQESGIPFALPTEAQWEYAARNRGEYVGVATDDGTFRVNKLTEKGENFANETARREAAKPLGIESFYIHFPVDNYPPNPMGLYNMVDNGYEWMSDWYDPDYYKNSPLLDPKGPAKPVVKSKSDNQFLKVSRSDNFPYPGFSNSQTFTRNFKVQEPDGPYGTTARCVVNSTSPVK